GGDETIVATWRSIAADLAGFASRSAGPDESASLSDAAPAKSGGLLGSVRAYLDGDREKQLEKFGTKKVCGATLYSNESFRKGVLDKFSAQLSAWKNEWFALGPSRWAHAERLEAEQGLALIHLARSVEDKVQDIKRRRGVLGFADFERKALSVLTDPGSSDVALAKSGAHGPSEIAHHYQRFFSHVLVDEYQDVSPLQHGIIRRLSHVDDPSPPVHRNLFIVGDLKQSIYRFRGADPSVFGRCLNQPSALSSQLSAAERPSQGSDAIPSAEGGVPVMHRVNLRTNFRSLPGILHCVNATFERLMDLSLGGIDYDEEARLAPERSEERSEPRDDSIQVEAHWIDPKAGRSGATSGAISGATSSGSGESVRENENDEPDFANATSDQDEAGATASVEREAQWIAHRIGEMTDPETGVWIPDENAGGGRRRARPSDCAILVRRMKTDADLWISTMARFGLKVRAPGTDPLLNAPEIVDLLCALRLANNPMQDVPLAAILRSPMVGLNETELLELRRAEPHGPFHEAVWRALGRGGQGGQIPAPSAVESLRTFFENLDRWRDLAMTAGPDEVLEMILRDTDYEAHLSGLPDALARLKNLNHLRNLLRRYSGRMVSASRLSDFLSAIDDADGSTSSIEDSETAGTQDDAVHLLTIHKSKGLEFPIVFLARLSSPFGGAQTRNDVLLDPDGGMTYAGIDPERRLRMRSLQSIAMAAEERRASRAEEFRLLYVAMTRARERLVLVGTASKSLAEGQWKDSPITRGDRVPTLLRLSANSPIDLLGPILQHLDSRDQPSWLRIEHHDSLPVRPGTIELKRSGHALTPDGSGDPAAWRRARQEFITVFGADDRAGELCNRLKEAMDSGDSIPPPP
ncbi:UvrD-helicase domain-containing protein, partial [Candidatus Sumerlaeota bacterium]|nr:UvrD-helicase domain-containing protein [Candidatus Sumerlaeota bacterium]